MKKFFKAIGKAALYFLSFLGIQVVVSFVSGIVLSVKLMLENGVDVVNEAEYIELFTAKLTEYTTFITLISNILALAIIWLFFKIRKKKFFSAIQLIKCPVKSVSAAGLFGIGFGVVLNALISIIPFSESMKNSFTDSYSALSAGNAVISFISVAILAPIVEEVFFRGLIYTRLKSGMNKIAAAVISSLLFGVMHGEIIWMLTGFIAGLALVWIFEKTKSLLGCIAVHIANNTLSQLTAEITEIPDWVSYIILGIAVILLIGTVIYINSAQKTNNEGLKINPVNTAS